MHFDKLPMNIIQKMNMQKKWLNKKIETTDSLESGIAQQLVNIETEEAQV